MCKNNRFLQVLLCKIGNDYFNSQVNEARHHIGQTIGYLLSLKGLEPLNNMNSPEFYIVDKNTSRTLQIHQAKIDNFQQDQIPLHKLLNTTDHP